MFYNIGIKKIDEIQIRVKVEDKISTKEELFRTNRTKIKCLCGTLCGVLFLIFNIYINICTKCTINMYIRYKSLFWSSIYNHICYITYNIEKKHGYLSYTEKLCVLFFVRNAKF